MEEIENMSNKELVDTYHDCFESVYGIGCFGISDLKMLALLENEIERRGGIVREDVRVDFVDEDLDLYEED